MSLPTSTIANCYKQFAEIPVVSSGRLITSTHVSRYDHTSAPPADSAAVECLEASIITSQENLIDSTKINYQQSFALSPTNHHPTSFPNEISSRHKLTAVSSSGRRRAVVVTTSAGKNPNGPESKMKTTTIEIYQSDRRALSHNFEHKHGEIHTSGPFAGMTWSPDESRVAYVAEAKAKTKRPLYDSDKAPSSFAKGGDVDEAGMSMGGEYEYEENFGEMCEKYRNPEIWVLTVDTGDTQRLDCFDSHQHPGRPVWFPSPSPSTSLSSSPRSSVVVTVWEAESDGRRLGMIYYSSRRSFLASVEILDTTQHGALSPLTSTKIDQSACDPRFSPDGKKCVFLTAVNTELHGTTLRLRMLVRPKQGWHNISAWKPPITIVEIPRSPRETRRKSTSSKTSRWSWTSTTSTSSSSSSSSTSASTSTSTTSLDRSKFLGLYAQPGATPERIWLSSSNHVVLTSKHRSSTVMMLITISSQTCTIIETPRSVATQGSHRAHSATVLDVVGRHVLWKMSAAHKPDAVFFLQFGGDSLLKSSSSSKRCFAAR